ncbi:extracellular solute-binding protein [Glycomyces albidus]|jgi:raffinose/stachyose/melibiose transport system substrate-binding protein|uniref:Extracellular solute-binding protein n=1 Tax=Glycomyces albidus TaxID=2656774 RepID=A0A6L5G7V7_9ACTN|nr:extracellular solute-binding protein [Glycomyces albidus]MQM25742.1 extracellular solute-binding protein [Glycomyces albidus]
MRNPLLRPRALVAAGAAAALALSAAACGDSGESDADITWWHIQNQDPLMSTWQEFADDFSADNDLTMDVQAIENQAFKDRMGTASQSGDVPDIFHTWGGGVLAEQVEAGLVKDLTGQLDCIDQINPIALEPYTIDGKLYGMPFDAGVVGFWYNMDLFAQAGIDQPPATWDEFLSAVEALKEAGIAPIALAGADKWPGHYYWTYLVMRTVGLDGLEAAAESGDFSGEGFIQAGEMVAELAALEPFQPGFESAVYGEADGQAAVMGEGLAAMELMGQWAPQAQRDNSGTEGPENLGFFPFPTVEGGAGTITEWLGGGNGYAVAADAPDEALDFLCNFMEPENYSRAIEEGNLTPVAADVEAVAPELNEDTQKVVDALATATGTQLYLDQAYPPAIGSVINDATEGLILGQVTPEEFVQMVNDAWAAEA